MIFESWVATVRVATEGKGHERLQIKVNTGQTRIQRCSEIMRLSHSRLILSYSHYSLVKIKIT